MVIDNCKFDRSREIGYEHVYTAIGVHTANDKHHQNITITNCEIRHAEYSPIHGIKWNNVKIISNKFIDSTDLIFDECTNLVLDKNIYDS